MRDGFHFCLINKEVIISDKVIKFKSTFCYKNEVGANFLNKLILLLLIKQKRFSKIKLILPISIDSC